MKKISLVFILLILSSLAGIYYYWYQVTKLPDWYTSQEQSNNQPTTENGTLTNFNNQPEKEDPKITLNVENNKNPVNPENSKIQLSQSDVNKIVVSKIAQRTGNSNLHESIKGINTTIKNDKLESGAVVNISKLPTEKLGESDKLTINKLNQKFPGLTNRDVYIGIAGKPTVVDGQLKFNDNTEVKIGNLSFTIDELSNKLGIPKEKIVERINLELQRGTVKVKQLEPDNNKPTTQGLLQSSHF